MAKKDEANKDDQNVTAVGGSLSGAETAAPPTDALVTPDGADVAFKPGGGVTNTAPDGSVAAGGAPAATGAISPAPADDADANGDECAHKRTEEYDAIKPDGARVHIWHCMDCGKTEVR